MGCYGPLTATLKHAGRIVAGFQNIIINIINVVVLFMALMLFNGFFDSVVLVFMLRQVTFVVFHSTHGQARSRSSSSILCPMTSATASITLVEVHRSGATGLASAHVASRIPRTRASCRPVTSAAATYQRR